MSASCAKTITDLRVKTVKSQYFQSQKQTCILYLRKMEAETASTGDQIDVLLLSLSINGCCGSHLTTAAGIEIQRRGVLLRQLA